VSGAAAPSRWFTTPRPQPGARLRLVCLPHAGAGASTYAVWGRALEAAGIEVRAVQYPGRENRLADPPIKDARAMVAALADLWPLLGGGGHSAIYGHSMGALIGFELALELARRGAASPPLHLFFSGRNPPHLARKLPPMHGLPDGEFLAEVARRYSNLPPELLSDRELCALVTPILRADFALVDGYQFRDGDQATVPLTILGGTADAWTSPSELAEWSRFTRASISVHLIAGDHFFHQKARGEVLAIVQAELAAQLSGRSMA
jgi:medium-chain acyl-[acyl-carrier-protein] hydrolase